MTFPEALSIVLKWEGGFSNDPQDPGGITNLGITKEEYERISGRDVTETEMRALTIEQVTPIYLKYYWTPAYCDHTPEIAKLIVFDCAVNQGVTCATKIMQDALGMSVDGLIGPHTRLALTECDPQAFKSAFAVKRAERYWDTANKERFGLGWFKRLVDVASR